MTHNFEKLDVYRRSLALSTEIIKVFHDKKPFRIAEQICACSISIPSNISEGSERSSLKDFRRFLEYASGSASELYTQLKILQEADFIEADYKRLTDEVMEIRSMIRSLIYKYSTDQYK